MNKITWQYLAGYFDGEGTYLITVGKEKRKDRQGQTMGYRLGSLVSIHTCDLEVMNLIADFLKKNNIVFGKRFIPFYKIKKAKKDSIQIQICARKSVSKFIKSILPYVIAKREELSVHKEFMKIVSKKPLRPKTNTNADYWKMKIWTKELILEGMKLYDKLSSFKSRRQGKKKYSYAFLKKAFENDQIQ